MTAHYFVFKSHLGQGPRPCGECGVSYDVGDHIEITTLKPYTHYVCPVGNGQLGHSSIYTGSSRPELRGLRDHICMCGTEFVEEDHEKWNLSWQMQSPPGSQWRNVSVVESKHAAQAQQAGLLELIAEGEPIRKVALKRVSS